MFHMGESNVSTGRINLNVLGITIINQQWIIYHCQWHDIKDIICKLIVAIYLKKNPNVKYWVDKYKTKTPFKMNDC